MSGIVGTNGANCFLTAYLQSINRQQMLQLQILYLKKKAATSFFLVWRIVAYMPGPHQLIDSQSTTHSASYVFLPLSVRPIKSPYLSLYLSFTCLPIFCHFPDCLRIPLLVPCLNVYALPK